MGETRYRVVCGLHTPPVPLADITWDPNQEASQRYERKQRRWDRHNAGEETIVDEVTGIPYPRNFRPYLHRFSSGKITVIERPYIFVPELVESYGPKDTMEYVFWVSERAAEGKPVPRDGYVRVVDCEIGDTEHADGRTITIACALCEKARGKPLFAFASADTLAMVLDRIGARLEMVSMPVIDQRDNKPTGEIVEVRMVTLYELRKELGDNPHG
jgi:hypothetical protein